MPEIFASPTSSQRSLWQGTQPLWKAFWLVYVAGHVLFAMVLAQLVIWLQGWYIFEGMSEIQLLGVLTKVCLAIYAVMVLYFAVCAVMVWRCGASSANAFWCWSSRAVLLVHGLWLLMQGVALAYLLRYGWEISLDYLMSL